MGVENKNELEKTLKLKKDELDDFVKNKLRYPDRIKKALGDHCGSDITEVGYGFFSSYDTLTSIDLSFSDGTEKRDGSAVDGYDARKIESLVSEIKALKNQIINS